MTGMEELVYYALERGKEMGLGESLKQDIWLCLKDNEQVHALQQLWILLPSKQVFSATLWICISKCKNDLLEVGQKEKRIMPEK